MHSSDQSHPDTSRASFGGQLRRLRRAVERKREQSRARAEEQSLISDERQPDQLSTRAKSSGHGKKTADKWNQ
jgi:5'-3' exonuclease